jgi:hypothetical protein
MPSKKNPARRRSLKERYRVLSRDQEKKKVGEAQKLGANPRDKKRGCIGKGNWQLKASLGSAKAAPQGAPQHQNKKLQ